MIEFTYDATAFVTMLVGAPDRARKAVAAKVYALAQTIMTDAKANYVPHDKGLLAASGTVDLPVIAADTIACSLQFGGAAAAYALAVHEHLSEHSPPSWQVAETSGAGVHFSHGGPKYLERPVLEHSPLLPEVAGQGLLEAMHA